MSRVNSLCAVAQVLLADIALTIALEAEMSTGEWDRANPWVNRIGGRFAKGGSDVATAISEAAKSGADAAIVEEKAFLLDQVTGINAATSKASEQIAETLSAVASTQTNAAVSAIQKTSTRITENVLTGADEVSAGSDLGKKILGSEVASERIQRIGSNLLQLASDISSVTLASFAIVAEKAVEADTGRDIEDIEDIEEELEEAGEMVISEESAFLSSQGEGLKKLAQRVSNSITPFFTTNVEAYYEERSEAGEKQHEVVKEILRKAKEKNAVSSIPLEQ